MNLRTSYMYMGTLMLIGLTKFETKNQLVLCFHIGVMLLMEQQKIK
jgi:hypothetical protein